MSDLTTIEIAPVALGDVTGNLREKVLTSLRALATGHNKRKVEHQFRILNSKDGDKRVIWDSLNLEEIRDAHKFFNELVDKGMVPYKVDPKGKKTAEVMREFDPTAEEILFAPIQAVAGG